MFYLSGNKRGNLIGVVDTDDMIEEFYSPEFLGSVGVEIIRFNKELEIGYTFKTKYFNFTLIEEGSIKGWKLRVIEVLGGTNIFRNKASYLGYPVISLKDCFYDFYSKKLDIRGMDTSNVINMAFMFDECTNLTTLDLSNFDTSQVTNMEGMFNDCHNLVSLDLSNFNTSKVTSMRKMFSCCKSLTTLDLSNFNTFNVINMEYMFCECLSLTTLDVSNFDTSNVSNMIFMFNSCINLINLDLSNFDTSNVTNMASMFEYCESLTTLDVSNFDTSNVSNMIFMFNCCESLIMLHTSDKDIFSNCDSRIKLVPKSLGVEYDKLIKNKKDVVKYVLLNFKGVIAYENS